MVECQWDSVVLSPYSPVLTGLELTFMCLTRSNSSLFITPGFVVAPSDLSMSSIFGLWSLYMLEYCWLFALLLRLARYFPGVAGKWIPLPPMLPPSSRPKPKHHLRWMVVQKVAALCPGSNHLSASCTLNGNRPAVKPPVAGWVCKGFSFSSLLLQVKWAPLHRKMEL